jgi:hypothetical protein
MTLNLKMSREIVKEKLACRMNLRSNHDAVPVGGCVNVTQIMPECGSLPLCSVDIMTVVAFHTIRIEKEC